MRCQLPFCILYPHRRPRWLAVFRVLPHAPPPAPTAVDHAVAAAPFTKQALIDQRRRAEGYGILEVRLYPSFNSVAGGEVMPLQGLLVDAVGTEGGP